MGLCKILIQKKSETRGKNGQVSEVELGVQRYPPEWKKMDTCPIVELEVLGAHLKKKRRKKRKKERERETEKKRKKKIIAHRPSNKQYASKR